MPPRKSSAKQVQTPKTDRTSRSRGPVNVDPSDYSAVDRPRRTSSRISSTGTITQANNAVATPAPAPRARNSATSNNTQANNVAATTTPAPANLGAIAEQTTPSSNNASGSSSTVRTSRPQTSHAQLTQPQALQAQAPQAHTGLNLDRARRIFPAGTPSSAQTPTPVPGISQQTLGVPSLGRNLDPRTQPPSAVDTTLQISGNGYDLFGDARGRPATNRASATPASRQHVLSPVPPFRPTIPAAIIQMNTSQPDAAPVGRSSSRISSEYGSARSNIEPSEQNANDNDPDDSPDDSPDGSSSGSFASAYENPIGRPSSPSFVDFYKQYFKQMQEGFRYFENHRLPIVIALALGIMGWQLCSAGDICEQNQSVLIILQAFQGNFWSSVGLWVGLFLAFAGILDLLLGICTTTYEFLQRHEHHQPLFPFLFHSCVVPLLVLLVMFSMPEWKGNLVIGNWPRTMQLVCANGVAHLIKWLLETIFILYGPLPAPTLRMQCLLVTLSVLLWVAAIVAGKYQSCFDEDWTAALRYWNGDRKGLQGEQISVHSLLSYPVQSMSRILTQVTHETITQWVQPTSNVQEQ